MDIAGIDDQIDLGEAKWVGSIPFPGMKGVELQVRSANYKPFQRARDKALREAVSAEDEQDEDKFWTVTGKAMAEHLLTGWKGVQSGGKDLKFSPDLALKLLTADDPHGIGERFRKGVDWASAKLASDLLAKTEKLAKN